jgi:ribosome biogenesis GTPase
VGKSTLANALTAGAGRALATGAIREADARGRHTTTARELVALPRGGALIDTPGLREIQLWDDGGVDRSFDDIASLAASCRFRDCAHDREPGCAVRNAVESGGLDAGRLTRYRKIERELARLERKKDVHAMRAERQRWKAITMDARRRSRPS